MFIIFKFVFGITEFRRTNFSSLLILFKQSVIDPSYFCAFLCLFMHFFYVKEAGLLFAYEINSSRVQLASNGNFLTTYLIIYIPYLCVVCGLNFNSDLMDIIEFEKYLVGRWLFVQFIADMHQNITINNRSNVKLRQLHSFFVFEKWDLE